MERLKAKKEENPGAQNDRHSLYNSTTPPGVSELQRDAATSMPAVLSYPRDLNITAPAKAIVEYTNTGADGSLPALPDADKDDEASLVPSEPRNTHERTTWPAP